MRLDPCVAQELADAARAVLASTPTGQPARARLTSALRRAEDNDAVNRRFVAAQLVPGVPNDRPLTADEAEGDYPVMPLRELGAYGS